MFWVDTKKVEYENHFFLDFPSYAQNRYQFQNIFHTANLPNLLTQQNYGDVRKLLLITFKHRNKILKKVQVIPYPLKVW